MLYYQQFQPPPLNNMMPTMGDCAASDHDLHAELARLRAENAALGGTSTPPSKTSLCAVVDIPEGSSLEELRSLMNEKGFKHPTQVEEEETAKQ